jgi:hypothetical protein
MSRFAWVAVVLIAASGASPDGAHSASEGPAGAAGTVGDRSSRAWVGDYAGTVTLPRGRFTYTWPATVGVEASGAGMLELSIQDLRAPVDHLDIAPPDTIVIILAPPGDRTFLLPDGDRATLNSIHARFPEDGETLEIALNGAVDGEDVEWNFVGTR